MANYSKLIGSIVGGVIGLLVSNYGLPAELNTPEMIAAVTALVCAAGTYFAPANKA